jgi:hypothetical protein
MGGGGNNIVSSSQGGFGGAPSRSTPGTNTSNGLYGNDLDNAPGTSGINQLEGAGLLGGSGLGGLGGLGGLQQSSSANPSSQLNIQTSRGANAGGGGSSGGPGVSGAATGTALSGDYGLLGLLGVIRMTDADRNALALGSDLTMLGLNLGSSEHIYNTFSGPWSESSGNTKEPHYQVGFVLLSLTSKNVHSLSLTHTAFIYLSISQCFVVVLTAERCLHRYHDKSYAHLSASDVLLYATPRAENWPLIEVSIGNTLLHLLCSAQGRVASICGARVVHKRVAISWRLEALVQESRSVRWDNHIFGHATISVL